MVCLRNRMEETSEKINPKRLKSFVKHLCILAKKHKDREKARIELQQQIQRLKRFSSKKREMDEELKELNRKISLVLEKEIQLLGIERGEGADSKKLMRNVGENRERIRQIYNSINDIKSRLEEYINFKTEREKRIDELEKKIRAKSNRERDFSILKRKLKDLENLYNKLKSRGIDVSILRGRIEDLKLRLDFA